MADGKISDLTAYGFPPTVDQYFYILEGSTDYKINGDEIRMWTNYAINNNNSNPSQSQLFVIFDSTVDDYTMTITGDVLDGHSITAHAKQVSGGTGHKILLPVGVTWDGTNRAAIFDTVGDSIFAIAYDSNRYLIISNNGVTFAAS